MPTVLIVEDEPSIRRLVAVNLVARGYDVIEAESGEEALVQLRERHVALILLDIKLPGIGGWEMLRLMGKDSSIAPAPVIVMTASVDAHEGTGARRPVARILLKPFDTQTLMKAVTETLH
jgi:CheY-like chemotaxis protein